MLYHIDIARTNLERPVQVNLAVFELLVPDKNRIIVLFDSHQLILLHLRSSKCALFQSRMRVHCFRRTRMQLILQLRT